MAGRWWSSRLLSGHLPDNANKLIGSITVATSESDQLARFGQHGTPIWGLTSDRDATASPKLDKPFIS
jgi:hypothetical protein